MKRENRIPPPSRQFNQVGKWKVAWCWAGFVANRPAGFGSRQPNTPCVC
jgi:hypothetical protein